MKQDEVAALCRRLRMFGRRDANAAAYVIELLVARLADHQAYARGLDDLEATLSQAFPDGVPRRDAG